MNGQLDLTLVPLWPEDRFELQYGGQSAALSNGAMGGKITGAGGGGYILLFCDFTKKHRLIEALEGAGAAITEFAFESKGLTTWQA